MATVQCPYCAWEQYYADRGAARAAKAKHLTARHRKEKTRG